MNGKIFNIQRFSIHDGPGIRTTVFFKGCNLRCAWCHNPESQDGKRQLLFDSGKCVSCGKCVSVCRHSFDFQACTACGKCVDVCWTQAREICGRDITSDELFEKIIKDKDFYGTTGGVTFSGGEPLLQADFLEEILGLCHKEKIHTAIETAANVPFSALERVLRYLDLIICDIKSLDSEKHRRLTGVDNRLILENAARLRDDKSLDVLFRMPYVPGYNAEEVGKIAAFVSPRRLELMPYHNLCVSKYRALRREFKTEAVVPPTTDELRQVTKKYSNVFFTENQ